MIEIIGLSKTFRTVEIETTALNNVSLNHDGATIIMVTHSPDDAEYANRIIHLFDGQIVTENIRKAV